jgi:hypothetical protein
MVTSGCCHPIFSTSLRPQRMESPSGRPYSKCVKIRLIFPPCNFVNVSLCAKTVPSNARTKSHEKSKRFNLGQVFALHALQKFANFNQLISGKCKLQSSQAPGFGRKHRIGDCLVLSVSTLAQIPAEEADLARELVKSCDDP